MSFDSKKQVVLAITGGITAVSATLANATVYIFVGAMGGFAWGLVLCSFLDWLRQRFTNLPILSVYTGVFVSTTLFGGALFAMMSYSSALTMPTLLLSLIQPPLSGGFAFFVIFNSLMEHILFPAMLYLNWDRPNMRKYLLSSAGLFYVSRVWTYLFFVPQVFDFQNINPWKNGLTKERNDQILSWIHLSWIRAAIDGIVPLLLLRVLPETNAEHKD